MRYIYALLLFIFLSCKAEQRKAAVTTVPEDTTPVMLQDGIPDQEFINQKNVAAKQYGVKFRSVGCVWGGSKADSVRRINDSVFKVVALKYGDNWLRKVNAQMDTFEEAKGIAYETIAGYTIDSVDIFYVMAMHGLRKNEYVVTLYTYEERNGKQEILPLYYVGVDLRKRSFLGITKAKPEKTNHDVSF